MLKLQTTVNWFWMQYKVLYWPSRISAHSQYQGQIHPHTYSPDKQFCACLFRLRGSLNKLACTTCSQIIPCLLCNKQEAAYIQKWGAMENKQGTFDKANLLMTKQHLPLKVISKLKHTHWIAFMDIIKLSSDTISKTWQHWSIAGSFDATNQKLCTGSSGLTCSPWLAFKSPLHTSEVTGGSASCVDTSDWLWLTVENMVEVKSTYYEASDTVLLFCNNMFSAYRAAEEGISILILFWHRTSQCRE